MDLLDLFDQAATESVLDTKDAAERDRLKLKRDLIRLVIPRIRAYATEIEDDKASLELANVVAALSSAIALAAAVFSDKDRPEFLAAAFKGVVQESSNFATSFNNAAAMLHDHARKASLKGNQDD